MINNIFWRKIFGCKCCIPRTTTLIRSFASFTLRDILHETSDETGTLITRFAKHIAMEKHLTMPAIPTTIRYSDYFPVTDMRYFRKELNTTESDQFPALITFAFTYRSNADPTKFAEILNDLDRSGMKLLQSMDLNTILRSLYSFLFLIPNWLTRLDFYRASLLKLCNDFEITNKDTFVQLCFYMGLRKNNQPLNKDLKNEFQQLLSENLEKYLSDMNTMDLTIVSNAAYKTSIEIKSNTYDERLVNEILTFSLNGNGSDALLVNFIKVCRFQRIHSDEICKYISNLCRTSNLLESFRPEGLTHIFSYFAESRWNEQTVNNALIKAFMQRLYQNSISSIIRGKDICMFLWCCAHLNCDLNKDDIKKIDICLKEKIQSNEFRYFADQLVDACLSLWTMGYKSKWLLNEAIAIKEESEIYKKNKRIQPKVNSRLTVLRSAVNIEEPEWFDDVQSEINLNIPAPEYICNNHYHLKNFAKKLVSEDGVLEVKIICPINGINIPSLLVKHDSNKCSDVLVELLTPEHFLKFDNELIGLMRLKMRLLNTATNKIVMLNLDDINHEKYVNLKSHLLEASESVHIPQATTICSN